MKKEVKINSSKELEKFYKFIPIYKSFLYKKVQFELANNTYHISEIINALNIKNRKARISYVYDTVCDEIDKNFVDKNICGFENAKCAAQKKVKSDKINGCCRKCYYQSSKGCITKNLTCKLFFCSEVTSKYDVCKFEDFKILNCLTIRQRILLRHNYFSSREDILTDLYIGSVFIGIARMSYRIIRKCMLYKIKK